MDKEQDLQFIKKFAQIKVLLICKRLKISDSNLWSGKASAKNIRRVREAIEKEYSAINGE